MLPSSLRVAALILAPMDLTSRVLVVLGFAAGAVTGAAAVAALVLVAGMDTHAAAAQLLMAIGGAGGGIVGARANLASGRLLVAERAGESWDRLSLHGKADFPALHAAHGQVYGYDSTSQTFMVSKDREEWDRRSELAMADFAVDPDDPETVLATTERGLVRSTDGGRSWNAVGAAPTMVVLVWTEQGQLYGVTPDGTVQRSDDGGTSWQARGSIGGQPEAITVDFRDGEQRLYVAAADRGILVSADQGRTFTTRFAS